ncbi:unknown [Collinsella sp. CAG:398]|nr:unknown [Collinsella sp. CAG:398]
MAESFERRLDVRLVASIVAAGSLSFCAVLLFLAGTLLSHSGTGPFWLTIRRLFAH